MGGFHALMRDQIAGAGIVEIFAIVSALAVTAVLFRLIYLTVRHLLAKDEHPREYVFFHTQLGYYLASLLVGNFCSSISGLIGLQWLVDGGVTDGSLCVSQGILMQLGNFSTAYFTIAIAIHTFLTLVLHKRQSLRVCAFFTTFGWIATATVVFSPLYFPQPFGPLYGPSGLSCGIRPMYPKEQVLFHLFPIFTASVLSAILYSLIFLVLRGTLMIKGGLRLTLGPPPTSRGLYTSEGYHRFMAAVARSMLWYPFVYIILLIPYSITRMLSLSGFTVAFGGIALAFTFFYLLGLANVALLYNTFRVLGPAFDTRGDSKDMESFSATAEHKRYTSGLALGLNTPKGLDPASPRLPNPPHPPYQRQDSRYSTQSKTSSIGLLIPKANVNNGPEVPGVIEFRTLDREISPSSELSRNIEITSDSNAPSGLRQFGSTDTLNSLPAPPRPTRSPVSYEPDLYGTDAANGDSIAEVRSDVGYDSYVPSGSVSPSTSIPHQSNMRSPLPTSDPSRSSTPSAMEISEWLARQTTSGSPSRSGLTIVPAASSISPERLQLSAVASQTSFPSPTLSYYHSAGSSAIPSSPRPLPPLPSSPYTFLGSPYDRDYVGSIDTDSQSARSGLPDSPPGKSRLMPHKPSYSAFGGGNSGSPRRQPSTASGHTIQHS